MIHTVNDKVYRLGRIGEGKLKYQRPVGAIPPFEAEKRWSVIRLGRVNARRLRPVE